MTEVSRKIPSQSSFFWKWCNLPFSKGTLATFILSLACWGGWRWPTSPSSLVVLVPLTSCSRLDPFMPLRRKQGLSQVREAVFCLAGQVALVQISVGSTEPFAPELDCDMASSDHEQLLVSVFSPSTLVGRDLLKAGYDAQLSLGKNSFTILFLFPVLPGSCPSHLVVWMQVAYSVPEQTCFSPSRGEASAEGCLPFHL